ncbi:hypothetical protein [Flavobacterium aciduliphilum]|uniref:SprT-like family protein n=1 Tax=Flavobacterium aciduliphilum TaxID=1101402 RepID=A0A328YI76_9FLAO|nr:hypothetical protein [Flavobacterium aciduliphilum]RAR73808.1 hypothetical protein CLV55_103127 [Flavobacterium aciduliphilum]
MITTFQIILSISIFWNYWLLYMISLGLLYVIGLVIEDNKKNYQSVKNYRTKKNQKLNVNKSKFVNLVIDWCKQNLEHPRYHKYYPIVEVKYYKTKKVSGDYSSSKKIIRIFVNNHQTISELVDTCIHEYIHYLQMPFQSNQVEYDKLNKTNAYYNNPYEVEAREKAAFHTPQCIKELKRLGYIS